MIVLPAPSSSTATLMRPGGCAVGKPHDDVDIFCAGVAARVRRIDDDKS